jgi:hypothetical protein
LTTPKSQSMPLNKLINKLRKWNYQQGDDVDMRAYVIKELKQINDTHVIIDAFSNNKVITPFEEYKKRKA